MPVDQVDPFGDTPPPRDPLIGVKVDGYEILERIGSGGMGLVYKGRHVTIGRACAIKVMKPELAVGGNDGLLKEARAVSQIRNRGIVDIYGFGLLPTGQQYLVMELLDGEPLDKVLKREKKLSVERTLLLLEEIIQALDAAHTSGVIHRDLKPSNVFLVNEAGEHFIKLLDFGLAKSNAGVRGETAQTNVGGLSGTPEYMSPEQAKGLQIGPYSDLYSVGCIGYEMLTGKLPFPGGNPLEILIGHVQKPVPSAKEADAALHTSVDQFVARLMQKSPTDRPANAQIALNELRAVMQAAKGPDSAPAKPKAPARKSNKVFIGAIASIGVAVLASVAFMMRPREEVKPTPPPVVVVAPPPVKVDPPPPVVVEKVKEPVVEPPPVVVPPPKEETVAKVKKNGGKKSQKETPALTSVNDGQPLVVVLANVPTEEKKVEAPNPLTERTRLLGRIAQLEQRFNQGEEPDKLAQGLLATYRERALHAQTLEEIGSVGKLVDKLEDRFK